jgi:ABC-type multidrug transport system ATPase subunit
LRESLRIENSNINELVKNEPLVVKNLKKEFHKNRIAFMAVNNISFGIKSNECFGLLGLNGAGKVCT